MYWSALNTTSNSPSPLSMLARNIARFGPPLTSVRLRSTIPVIAATLRTIRCRLTGKRERGWRKLTSQSSPSRFQVSTTL